MWGGVIFFLCIQPLILDINGSLTNFKPVKTTKNANKRPISEPEVIFSFLRADFKNMFAQWENEGKNILAIPKWYSTIPFAEKMPEI